MKFEAHELISQKTLLQENWLTQSQENLKIVEKFEQVNFDFAFLDVFPVNIQST